MSLPQRRFYPIDEVADAWDTGTKVLIDYAVEKQLEISARLFGVPAERRQGDFPGFEPSEFIDADILAGVYPLLPADLWTLRCHGVAKVRAIGSRDAPNIWFQIAVEQHQLEITSAALLVTAEERTRFERDHALPTKSSGGELFVHSSDYRTITLNGCEFVLSSTRARIVRILHEAWCTGRPWVNKSLLLHAAVSSSSRVADVFTDVRERREILVSDRQGHWRLNLPVPDTRKRAYRQAMRRPHLTLVK